MIYCFLASGFEEAEAATAIDLVRKAGKAVTVVSVEAELAVAGMTGLQILADKLFDACDFSDMEMALLPGGIPGVTNLEAHTGLCRLLQKAKSENIWIAAICAAPMLLEHLGLLHGICATISPGFVHELKSCPYVDRRVVVSDRIITSQGPGTAVEFAVEIIRQLLGQDAAEQTKADILASF